MWTMSCIIFLHSVCIYEHDMSIRACMPTTTINAENHKKNKVPTWVPVALLGVSTAALIIPVVLLKRQRTNALTKVVPPPRRTSSIVTPAAAKVYQAPPRPPLGPSSSKSATPVEDENFNGALYTAKAFGIATLFVTLTASAGVWGVQTYLGVNNTEEFGKSMRRTLLEKMPVLTSRLHRPAEDADQPADLTGSEEQWEWEAAQQRLTEAFDKNGFSGWAKTALKEVEAEDRLERWKRNHMNSDSSATS